MGRPRLVVATRNQHKLRELAEILTGAELAPLPGAVELPPEAGDTFADNALIKARAAREATGKAAIADDSGIAARALGGRPGVRSARYAGEGATDEENLSLLISELDGALDRTVAYVCVIAYLDEAGDELVFEGTCEGELDRTPWQRWLWLRPGLRAARHRPDGRADHGGARARREACDQPPRPRRAPARVPPRPPGRGGARAWGAAMIRTKTGAASLSVASNSILIALKLAAGAITGSIAIITEALHSAIDLMASVVALVSVRKADLPADAEHPYGHERVENLAAAIEGMLILVGAGVIVYEATRRLAEGSDAAMLDDLGIGIAVIAVSALVNVCISLFLRRRARELQSPALEGDAAHLGTDALTSLGVLLGLALVEITGEPAFDAITALCVAVAIVFAGIRILTRSGRVLVDESPPPEDLDRIEEVISAQRDEAPEIAGYHKLRARRSGAHLHVDMHLQYRAGTSLERAHALAHRLRDAIEAEFDHSEVLIHLEPEGSLRAPSTLAGDPGGRAGSARAGSRRPPLRPPRP